MVVGARTHTRIHTHTYTHISLSLPLTKMHLFIQSFTQSFPHSSFYHPFIPGLTGSHQSSSETDKCVTCQQSINVPFDLCRSNFPFVHFAIFLSVFPFSFPFIHRLSTHSHIQSAFSHSCSFSLWSSYNPIRETV